ncbi:cyanophycin synthetase family protein [Parafannyhessea umbonata]|uniref:cyanophycin synthetase family protein n=1 Tax=Parafannyhessea umbonata TaxID=604330 RepID=UPI003F9A93C7
MAQLMDIQRVEIGPENLTARVRMADGAPLMTSEDLQGTTRVYRLLPHIIEHACLGDAGDTFKACMGNTELAHLLEHVTVELLAQTDIAGDITSGRTFPIEGDPRSFDVEISCKDDVLTVAALLSAVWILDWAYTDGGDPVPDVDATVDGLRNLVASLGDEPGTSYKEKVKGEILADVQREYQEALAMREQEIAQREEEIEVARSEAEAAARERAEERARERARLKEERRRAEEEARAAQEAARQEEERARREQEEAAEAARRAEEDRLFEEVAREAERRTTVLMPDEGRESPEAVQASRDLPDAAVIEWQPKDVAPEPQAEPEADAPAPAAGEKDATATSEPAPEPAPEPEPEPELEPEPRYAAPWEDEPERPAAPTNAEPLPDAADTSGSEGHIPGPQRVR